MTSLDSAELKGKNSNSNLRACSALMNFAWVHRMRCPHCNKEIPDRQIQQEAARIMIKKRPKRRLSSEVAREIGRKGLEKRWAKARKKH